MTFNLKVDVAINGRFLASPPAATYSVANQLSIALADHVSRNGKYLRIGRVSLLVPRGSRATAISLPIETVGRASGNIWEQVSLPRATRGRLLLNFAARSPLFLEYGLTMVHDAQVFTTPQSYSPLFRETLKANIRLAGRLQRGLLTVSKFARDELASLGIAPIDRIHVIPNGVDHVLRVAPDDRVLQRHRLVAQGYFLALANTQPHKNISLLIKAFSRPSLAGQTLVLVGKATRADFIELGTLSTENVVFTGYVTDGEMRSLQTNAMATLMPSLTEGFGMPPVEGMILGTPAVIAPCGALPEVCGPGALSADPYDLSAWEAAVLRLATEQGLRISLAASGRNHAGRFTWAAAAQKLTTVIDATVQS